MFPEYRDLISKLKQEDAHFARIFDEHNELDDKISGLENNPVTSVTAQDEIDALKVKKLALKDQLFQLKPKANKPSAKPPNRIRPSETFSDGLLC